MTDYLTNDTDLTTVANAIRTKGGTSAPLSFPSGFVQAIADIPSGGSVGYTLTLHNTRNGSGSINVVYVGSTAATVVTIPVGTTTLTNVIAYGYNHPIKNFASGNGYVFDPSSLYVATIDQNTFDAYCIVLVSDVEFTAEFGGTF